MTYKDKYKELVDLLEDMGVLQYDDEWAIEIQKLIEEHEEK